MRWLAAILNCMRRENYEWRKEIGEIIFCMYLPIFWILVIWGLLGQGVMTRVPAGLVDDDQSPVSREVIRAIDANRVFGLINFENRIQALAALRQGEVYGIIAIPFGYGRDVMSGRGASISLYLDENRYAVAGTMQAEMDSIMSALQNESIFKNALHMGDGDSGAKRVLSIIHSDFYALGNMQFSFLGFLGGSLIPGVIMICAMLAFMTAILREIWHDSKREWLASAYGYPSAALIGKMVPHFAFYCLVFLFYMALFAGEGGFVPAGDLFLWFVFGAACLAVFAAMAILINAIAPSWRLALVAASGYAAPALPFTGFSIPLDSMSEYARAFAQALPLTWLIQGQSQIWTLGASIAHMDNTFYAFFLLFMFPLLIGYPLFCRKFWPKNPK